jgi:DNA-binding Lrp family transcriptional regulator
MIHTIETLHKTGRLERSGDCLIWNGAAGVFQTEIAAEMGVSQTTVWRILRKIGPYDK